MVRVSSTLWREFYSNAFCITPTGKANIAGAFVLHRRKPNKFTSKDISIAAYSLPAMDKAPSKPIEFDDSTGITI